MRDFQELASMLNALPIDLKARCQYDLFADALVWSDETPTPGPDVENLIGPELRGVWHYRTSLILGQPKEKFRLVWQGGTTMFSQLARVRRETQR